MATVRKFSQSHFATDHLLEMMSSPLWDTRQYFFKCVKSGHYGSQSSLPGSSLFNCFYRRSPTVTSNLSLDIVPQNCRDGSTTVT